MNGMKGWKCDKKTVIHFDRLLSDTWYDIDIYPHDSPDNFITYRVVTDEFGEITVSEIKGSLFIYEEKG